MCNAFCFMHLHQNLLKLQAAAWILVMVTIKDWIARQF